MTPALTTKESTAVSTASKAVPVPETDSAPSITIAPTKTPASPEEVTTTAPAPTPETNQAPQSEVVNPAPEPEQSAPESQPENKPAKPTV